MSLSPAHKMQSSRLKSSSKSNCNRTNPILPFNPMVNYFDTSPVQVGNPCLTSIFVSASQNLNFSPSLSLTLHSLNLHTLCLSVNQSSPILAYPTQTNQQKQRKNSNAPSEILTPKHSHLF